MHCKVPKHGEGQCCEGQGDHQRGGSQGHGGRQQGQRDAPRILLLLLLLLLHAAAAHHPRLLQLLLLGLLTGAEPVGLEERGMNPRADMADS
jgi:hypothetical protein